MSIGRKNVKQEVCWVVTFPSGKKEIVSRQSDVYQYNDPSKNCSIKKFFKRSEAENFVKRGFFIRPPPKVVSTNHLPFKQNLASRKRKRDKKKAKVTIKDLSWVKWNRKQMEVLKLALEGKSLFFTGSAGTGKSLLIEKLRQELVRKHGKDAVFVTATTGVSSINVDGMTIHRWSGIGYERKYFEMLKRATARRNRWIQTKVLIIDEISMLDADMFDNLEKIACSLRQDFSPFGGIQIIVSGDFFQLPPVAKFGQAKFCFEAEKWFRCIRHNVNLEQVYRQQNDEFVKVLNLVRVGRVTREVVQTLRSCVRPLSLPRGIEPTRLYSTNAAVNRINENRLKRLKTPLRQYKCDDYTLDGRISSKYRTTLLDSTQALSVLKLKRGAQVILVQNLSDTLVNGSRGYIVGFRLSGERFGGKLGLLDTRKKRQPKWKQEESFYTEKFYKKFGQTHVPVVQFANGEKSAIEPQCFRVKIRDGQVMRVQIPLKCAWALTIHKCQGLSIDAAEISMENMFCDGQFYVALSRVRSLKGLCLKNFDQRQIRASKKVMDFMHKNFRGYRWNDGNHFTQGMRKQSVKPPNKKRKLNPHPIVRRQPIVIEID